MIGEAGGGFRIMLHLMNAARITVGLQSLGGLEAAIAPSMPGVKDAAALLIECLADVEDLLRLWVGR